MAVGKAGRRGRGCWRRWAEIRGSPNLGEVISANPRPTSTDIGQLALDQRGRASSANLGQPQPTSVKSAEGPSKYLKHAQLLSLDNPTEMGEKNTLTAPYGLVLRFHARNSQLPSCSTSSMGAWLGCSIETLPLNPGSRPDDHRSAVKFHHTMTWNLAPTTLFEHVIQLIRTSLFPTLPRFNNPLIFSAQHLQSPPLSYATPMFDPAG
ncbi:hypothetical protein B0H14DRAFT_2577398 [Mycena olivaceomarginata]|nr:hypothetical protein B0H14DRAFT_2621665 [Mycena olivaceomarginata]KAJ7859021.1 hypothetical protein B0H14DRAFT_2577398 [Mycena olivaceomarginata]